MKCSLGISNFLEREKGKSLSHVRLFAIPWPVAYHAPPSMGFSRQEYWSVLPFPSPGDLPHPGIKQGSPALYADGSLVFPILLFSSISLHWSLRKAFLSLLAILWNSSFKRVSLLFSLAFCFSSFLRYLKDFLRLPFCLVAFLYLEVGFGHHLLYNIANLHPLFFRHSTRSNLLNLFVTSTA